MNSTSDLYTILEQNSAKADDNTVRLPNTSSLQHSKMSSLRQENMAGQTPMRRPEDSKCVPS